MRKGYSAGILALGLLAAGCGRGEKVYIMNHRESGMFVIAYQIKDGVYSDVNGDKKLDAFCGAGGRCELLAPLEDGDSIKHLMDGSIVDRDSPRGMELQAKFENEVLPSDEEINELIAEAKRRSIVR